jgi:hypothetical protein
LITWSKTHLGRIHLLPDKAAARKLTPAAAADEQSVEIASASQGRLTSVSVAQSVTASPLARPPFCLSPRHSLLERASGRRRLSKEGSMKADDSYYWLD